MPEPIAQNSTPSANSPSLHHIGIVVPSIADTAEGYAHSLGISWNREIIHDPIQQARITFLRSCAPHQPAIELVESAGDDSPLCRFAAHGGGLHHVCYEIANLPAQLQQSRAAGCLIIRQPAPALAFGARSIAWVYTPQKLLVEFLERAPQPDR